MIQKTQQKAKKMLKSNYTQNITNQEAATKGQILMDQLEYENFRINLSLKKPT